MTAGEIKEVIFDDHVKKWINEILLFYSTPLKFLSLFLKKPFFERIYQVVLYFIICALIAWLCFYENYSFAAAAKLLLESLTELFYRILALLIVCWLMARICKIRYQSQIIIWSVILGRLLFYPIPLLLTSAFFRNENYNYLLAQKIIMLPLAIYTSMIPIFFIFKRLRHRIISTLFLFLCVGVIYLITVLFSIDSKEYNFNSISYRAEKNEKIQVQGQSTKYNMLRKMAYLTIDPLSKEFLDFDDSIEVNFFEMPLFRYFDIARNGDTLRKGIILSRCISDSGLVNENCHIGNYFDTLTNSLNYMHRNGNDKIHSKIVDEYYKTIAKYLAELYTIMDPDLEHPDDSYMLEDSTIVGTKNFRVRKYFKVNIDKINEMQKEVLRQKKSLVNSITWANEPYLTMMHFLTSSIDIQKANYDFYPLFPATSLNEQ
jgi:hypothetical protein